MFEAQISIFKDAPEWHLGKTLNTFQKVKIIIVNHKRELSVKRITKIKFRILYYLRLTYNQTIN